MNYDEALAYLGARLRFGMGFHLERMEALLARQGGPQSRFPAVHVAGTKGKGSTCAFLDRILRCGGYRVGLYTSPHLRDYRERIRIDGRCIGCAAFAAQIETVRAASEQVERDGLGPVTEFETLTAAALRHFAERSVDIAVIETGLGGRLDATNVLTAPLVCVITAIGLDHQEILGETLAEIAREKAGIVKEGVPCVTTAASPEALAEIEAACRRAGAPLIRPRFGVGPRRRGWIATDRRRLDGLRLGLRGEYQWENAAAAVTALDTPPVRDRMPLSEDAIRRGLACVRLAWRLETIGRRPRIVVDVAHNALSAAALASELERLRRPATRLHLIVGMRDNHDPDTFLTPFAALSPIVYATQPPERGHPAAKIADAAGLLKLPVAFVGSASAALQAARAAAAQSDLIGVCGSFGVVGAALGPDSRRVK